MSQVPQSCCADRQCSSPLARCSWPSGARCRCTRLARCPLRPDATAQASLAAPSPLGPGTSAHASLAAPGPLGPDAPAARSPPGQPPPLPQRRPVPRQRCWTSAPPARNVPLTSSTTTRPLRSARARRRRDRPRRARRYTAPPFAAPGQGFSLPAPAARPPVPRPRRLRPSKRQPHHCRSRFPCHALAPGPVPARLPHPVHHRRRPTDPGEPTARYQAAIIFRPRGRTLQPGGSGATHAVNASLAASGPRREREGGGRQLLSTVFSMHSQPNGECARRCLETEALQLSLK